MTNSTHSNVNDRSDVSYTITTQGATYNNDAIEAALISDIIQGFDTTPGDFIVVDLSQPIEGCSYMQASPAGDAANSIIVELRLDNADESFKHYSYETTDTGEVIRMFLDYWGLQKLPDWTRWSDITDDMK